MIDKRIADDAVSIDRLCGSEDELRISVAEQLIGILWDEEYANNVIKFLKEREL